MTQEMGPMPTTTTPQFLNVILHGLSCIVIDGQCIEIQVPCVPGHSYWAGNLHHLQELCKGEQYHLEGVCFGAKPDVDCTQHIVFRDRLKVNRGSYFFYTTIFLPLTEYVIPAVTARAPAFFGKDAPNPRPDCIPLVTVLKYKIDHRTELALHPLKWSHVPSASHKDYVNLHIFMDLPHIPGSTVPPGHVSHAFSRAMCIWPGTECHVDSGSQHVTFHPVSGVDRFELLSLIELGRLKEKAADGETELIELIKAHVTSYPGDTPNCPQLTASNQTGATD